jgi:acetylornithine deacetylase/succinyl-diaminopimelate desuccinylase-like protein
VTTPPNFPVLPGQGWSVHKKPSFSTRVASHVSGREVRAPFYAQALYEFEVTFDGLASNAAYPGLGANSLQSLMALYLQVQGQFGTFLYTDPTDNAQAVSISAVPATGDGTNKVFTLQRTLGGVTEPVSWITGTPVVLDNGSPAGAFAVAGNTIMFTTAPLAGHTIAATCTYAFNCRFLDDQVDFENFMNGLWMVSSLKFRSVKP